jgi:competence protein ComEC
LRGQWGYAAISVVFGVAAAYSHFSFYVFITIVLYVLYSFIMLKRMTFLICLLGMICAFFYANEVEMQNVPRISPQISSFTGVVENSPLIDGDKLLLIAVTHQKEKLRLSYKIASPEEKKLWEQLKPGISCKFEGVLQEPSTARNPNAFDYREYLRRQHIHYIFKASSISSCQRKNPSFVQWLLSVRQSATQYVQQSFPKETTGFINSLVYGERQDISEEVETYYQELGLIHLLAISGSHISLLAAVCYYLLLRSGITKENATALLLVILPVYMFLAGASPSVVRASLMSIFILTYVFVSKRLSGMDALSITAIVMIVWNPYVLYDIGFQFSFLSTAVLLLSAPAILSQENWLRSSWNLALAAQISAIPVTLHYFGQISSYSLLLNLLYVPYLSFVILPLCLAALSFSFLIPPFVSFISPLLSFLIHISNELLAWWEHLPLNRLTFGNAPPWLTLLYSLTSLLIFIAWEGKVLKQYRLHISSLLLALGVFHYAFPYLNPNGNITFIDVGQGDCILIQLPYARGTYLIDTGGSISIPKQEWQKQKREYTVGADIVLPYLRSKGIKQLDKLILTHGDQDHMGAAFELLKNIRIKEIVLGSKKVYDEKEQQVANIANEKQIPVKIVKSGDRWNVGDISFFVLSPKGDEREKNDQSIVVYTKLGGKTWLFTGDMEEEREQKLLEEYPRLQADVLKAGHHGSKTSTSEAFLQKIQPKTAIISVGQKNRYGHPHKEVLQRLKKQGITIWRTDQEGAITYTFRGETGTFHTQLTYDESTEQTKNKTARGSLTNQ